MIIIKNLTVGYRKGNKTIEILKKIDNQTDKNGLIALLGENGSGKTTLIKTLAKLIAPLDGSITIAGIDLNSADRKTVARNIAYVPTSLVSVAHLSVFDYVAFGRYPHKSLNIFYNKKDMEKIENALIQTSTIDLRDKYLSELSDGQRQRVMIARALAQDTPVILLDEPTAFLDVKHKYSAMKILHKLSENKLIIFSTHDISFALKISKYIWITHRQKLLHGTPRDLSSGNIINSVFGNEDIVFDKNSMDFVPLNP